MLHGVYYRPLFMMQFLFSNSTLNIIILPSFTFWNLAKLHCVLL
jgi:hypothetical protein